MPVSKITPRVVAIHPNANRNDVIGTGVQLDAKHVLTCAHVVAQAYGKKEQCHRLQPEHVVGESVYITLERFNGNREVSEAKVLVWYASKEHGDAHTLADIALLQLTEPLPEPPVQTPYLKYEHLIEKDECIASGFPNPSDTKHD